MKSVLSRAGRPAKVTPRKNYPGLAGRSGCQSEEIPVASPKINHEVGGAKTADAATGNRLDSDASARRPATIANKQNTTVSEGAGGI